MDNIIFEQLKSIRAADDNLSFTDLVALSGLEPQIDFQFADLSGISFSSCDLERYNFRGARLIGCDFTGARLRGACFDQCEIDRVPSVSQERTDLRSAFDWQRFCDESNSRNSIDSDSHLKVGAIFRDYPLGPELVVVPGGTVSFLIDGQERHAEFDRSFAVCREPITEWELATSRKHLGRKSKRSSPSDRWDVPATQINRRDVDEYLSWVSYISNREYFFLEESHWAYIFGHRGVLNFSNNDRPSRGKENKKKYPPNDFGIVQVNIPELGVAGEVPETKYRPRSFWQLHDGKVSVGTSEEERSCFRLARHLV